MVPQFGLQKFLVMCIISSQRKLHKILAIGLTQLSPPPNIGPARSTHWPSFSTYSSKNTIFALNLHRKSTFGTVSATYTRRSNSSTIEQYHDHQPKQRNDNHNRIRTRVHNLSRKERVMCITSSRWKLRYTPSVSKQLRLDIICVPKQTKVPLVKFLSNFVKRIGMLLPETM
jgi:hypothetical protein